MAPLRTHMWAPDVCRGADGRYYIFGHRQTNRNETSR